MKTPLIQQGCFCICTSIIFVFEPNSRFLVKPEHDSLLREAVFLQIAGWSLFMSVLSVDEPSRSTTRNIWSTPAPQRTSTWSKKGCHVDHFLAPQLVYVHRDCHQRALSLGSSLHCKILLCVPLELGSAFLHYTRHLTDFIHLSLSLSLFISIISMDRLSVSFIFFYDIKLRRWAPVYLKVPLLKWKQYTYYCCFTFQCMASRVTAHRHTKKYTYPKWKARSSTVCKGMA